VVAILVAVVGTLIAVGAQRRFAHLIASPHGGSSHGEARPAGQSRHPDTLADSPSGEPRAPDPRALRDMAIVRYDALREMSGQLSFSVALLNAHGDGIVLTSINGRAESRTYAKAVVAGKAAQQLSPEEEEAIRAAQLGQGPQGPARVTEKPKITRETGARSTASFTGTD
jgi:hypothetical protein